MSTLKENMAAYEAMQSDLERDYFGKWVVFHNEELVGSYETSEEADKAAIALIEPDSCLVKQVGAQLIVQYIPTPIFDDDCLDEDGYPDVEKWGKQPQWGYRPRTFYAYPEGYWDDDDG